MDKKENTEATRTREAKPRIAPKESVAVFVILLLMLILLVPLGGLLYLCGRLSFHASLAICVLYPVAGIVTIFCLIAGMVRLTRDWRGDMKILLFTQICIPIVFVVLCLIGSPLLTKSWLWPDATPFTYGFRDRIRSRADIPAIRAWLRTFDKSAYQEPGDPVPPQQWPESLKALKPPWRVFREPDKKGNPQIRIVWGGAIFHWGTTIGMEDMEIPPAELDKHYEAWLLVEPGVYVYDW